MLTEFGLGFLCGIISTSSIVILGLIIGLIKMDKENENSSLVSERKCFWGDK